MAGETDGLMARIEAARDRERAAVLAARAAARGEASPADAPEVVLSPTERGRLGGRPRKYAVRPWEAEGVSRRTWERRRAKG